MTVLEILRNKGRDVVTIGPDADVREAIELLARHNIGALVVHDGAIHGIVSERDLVRNAAGDLSRLAAGKVRDVMTPDVITVGPDAKIHEVMQTMTSRRIRHLPIVEGDQLRGIVSIGDVVSALLSDLESENRQLHAYIAGSPA